MVLHRIANPSPSGPAGSIPAVGVSFFVLDKNNSVGIFNKNLKTNFNIYCKRE